MNTLLSQQVEELSAMWPNVELLEEHGKPYFRIPKLALPTKCVPTSSVALLCGHERDGYPSRLFFDQLIRSPIERNWNSRNVFILGASWNSFSWRVDPATTRLAQIVRAFLRALE